MRTTTLTFSKASAIAAGCALMIGATFFNGGKRYEARQDMAAMGSRNFAGAAEYYHWLKMDPATGKLNPDAMMDYQLRKNAEYMFAANNKVNSTSALGLSWSEVGPDNVGGRCRAIIIDKKNTSRFFAASVSGGLFVSTNSGNSWSPVNDQMSTLVISCMAQDGNGNIFIGTGEGMARGGSGDGNSAFPGGGLFRMDYNSSTDSYGPITLVSGTAPTHNASSFGNWSFIQDIQVSVNPIGGNYYVYVANYDGLYVSTDGGNTFTNAIPTLANFGMDVDVANDGAVYVALGSGPNSGNNRIYYSPAASAGAVGTFTNITPPASTTYAYSNYGRIELAVSKTNSNIVYASVAKPLNSGAATSLVIWQSLNAGSTWSNIGSGSSLFLPFATYGQGDYDHILEVFPDNDYEILLGGVDMFRWQAVNPSSAPSIGQWSQVSNGFQSPFNPQYCHADKHAIVFDPADPNTVYIGSDGGVARSTNRCVTYTEMNKGFNVTQFYALAAERDALWNYGPNYGQFNSAGVFGGSQDNGTQYVSGNGNTVMSSVEINGGDGFYTEASMLSPNTFFYTSYYGFLERTSSRDDNGAEFYPTRYMPTCGSAPSTPVVPGDYAFASFITPTALWESSNMTNSPDSVVFTADSLKMISAATGDGWQTRFKITLTKPQLSAVVNSNSIKITSGNQVITCTGTTFVGSVGTGVNQFYPSGDSLDVTFATAPAANAPVKVVAAVDYAAGSQISVMSASLSSKFSYTLTSPLSSPNSIKVQDPIQARLAVGLTGSVWVCKNPVNFSAVPSWVKVAGSNSFTSTGVTSSFSGTVQTLEFAGGDVLYVATTSGAVYRISGLASAVNDIEDGIDSVVVSQAGADSVWLCSRNTESPIKCDRIANFGKAVTSISPDPTNPDRVIITTGNYGSTSHVYYCATGTTCPISSNTSNFTVISTVDNPVYSSTFVQTSYGQTNPNMVLIGTEDGVYSIDLSNTSTGWMSEKATAGGLFPNVPVFQLKQQTFGNWECHNSGIIYAATHGRGFWQCKNYFSPMAVGVDEIQAGNSGLSKMVKAYPNPANEMTNVAFNLHMEKRITIHVYDLKGSKVKTVNCGKLNAGSQTIGVELDGIAEGTYIISVNSDNDVLGTVRIVKTNN